MKVQMDLVIDISLCFVLVEAMYNRFRDTFEHGPTVCFLGAANYGTERWFDVNQMTTEKLHLPIVLGYTFPKDSITVTDGEHVVWYTIKEM